MSSDADSDPDEDCSERSLKIAVVGEPSAGKTSIIRRFCYNEFTRQYVTTIGADFYIKRILLPNKREVVLKVSDIGGLELRGTMLDKYLYNTDIIVLVYDITNPSSFDYMNTWIDTICNLITSPPFMAIIGNKCDLEHQRAVRLDKTNQFVKDNGLLSFLMSAKTGESVSASMMDLVGKHLGIPLTKLQKDQHQSILTAELIPSPAPMNHLHRKRIQHTKTAVCAIQ